MLARLQKLIVLATIALTILVAAVLGQGRHILWASFAACLVLSAHAWLLCIEFALAYVLQSRDRGGPVRLRDVVRAWRHELRQLTEVFYWRQPFRSDRIADQVAPTDARMAGVVLVHGYACNRGLWNPWMAVLKSRRIPFIAVNLEPVFGSIECYAGQIERAVAALYSATDRPVVLVGRSMGGLAIRSWLSQSGAVGRVARVITVGTPHRGTWLARFGRTTNAREMRMGSRWLERLAASEGARTGTLFTCFYADCDNIVFPRECGTLPGAHNVHVPACAHLQMVFEPVV